MFCVDLWQNIRRTHLCGQLGPVAGSMSAAVLQSSAGPLLVALLEALPAEPAYSTIITVWYLAENTQLVSILTAAVRGSGVWWRNESAGALTLPEGTTHTHVPEHSPFIRHHDAVKQVFTSARAVHLPHTNDQSSDTGRELLLGFFSTECCPLPAWRWTAPVSAS